MAQIPIPRPPGGGRRRKPRRRRGLLVGLLALVLVLIATSVAFLVRGNDDPTAGGTTGPETSDSPTPTPTASPTPTVPTTPPAPKQPSALELVTKNKIYVTGKMGASRCREPGYRPISYAAVKAYYTAMLPCLNKSWYYTIRKAGGQFRPPKVLVYAGVLRTPCGTERGNRAYYCGSNETIYMPWLLDNRNYRSNQLYARVWMAVIFAHEYGHHVQHMMGILDASWRRQRQFRTSAAALHESRRRELQASCFGAVYLGADKTWFPFTGATGAMWTYAVNNAGDEFNKPPIRDHGNKTNHGWWSKRGFGSINPGLCNTFTASNQITS